MTAFLTVTPLERLQSSVTYILSKINKKPCIYISLNKPQKSVQKTLQAKNIDTSNLYFIDGVAAEDDGTEVIHISPDRLDLMSTALDSFLHYLHEPKYIVVDGLATLLIYNSENKVAHFVKQLTEYASKHDVHIYAYSPPCNGKELLTKIFPFFDKVQGVNAS